MQTATQASLTQARAALDEKRQHIEKVVAFGPLVPVVFLVPCFFLTRPAGPVGLLPV